MTQTSLKRLAEIRRAHPLRNTYVEIRAAMGQLEKVVILQKQGIKLDEVLKQST